MDLFQSLAEGTGYLLRRDAVAAGVDDRTLHRAVRTGELVRIRQGAYCPAQRWRASSAADRHLLQAHASQDLTPGRVALSHVSALAHYGAPLWQAPLEQVHVSRVDSGSSRRAAGVVHHTGAIEEDDIATHAGRLVTSPIRTVLDAATLLSVESGMVAGDWMLAQHDIDAKELWAAKEAMVRWPGTLRQEVTIRLLDGRSGSVGETRSRHLFWTTGLPCPVLQFPVLDAAGNLVAITDFAWPDRGVYGEFDGKVKYGRLLKPGQDAGDVVFEEKRREDQIRAVTNGTVVRFVWADLHPASPPLQRLRGLLLNAA